MMIVQGSSQLGRVVAATLVAMVMASCTSSEGDDQLPPYAHRESGGAVRIDLEEASRGSAALGEFNRITLRFEEDDIAFRFTALSLASGIRSTSLEEPPVKMSPVLTPGDGVADFFAAVWIDGETGELRYGLFLDTDWQDAIAGDISMHTVEVVPPFPLLNHIPVDFSEAARGVYHKPLAFAEAPDYLRCLGPLVHVTNIPGDYRDFQSIYSSLDGFEAEHLVVSFSGWGLVQEASDGAPGLGSDVLVSVSGSLSKERC